MSWIIYLSIQCPIFPIGALYTGQVLSRAASFHRSSAFSCLCRFHPFSFSSEISFMVSTAFQVLDLHRRRLTTSLYMLSAWQCWVKVYSSSDRSLKSQAHNSGKQQNAVKWNGALDCTVLWGFHQPPNWLADSESANSVKYLTRTQCQQQ